MAATRDRIVEASAELFRRQGYAGTGVKRIVSAASAPFGSLYHFFPGGKEQLGVEVIRWSGGIYEQLIDLFFEPEGDVAEAVESFFVAAGETLVETGYADACPIATVALEVASTNEPLREATADVFASWIETTSDRFEQGGVPEAEARRLAIASLAALEGAFVLCRAQRTVEPLHIAGATMAAAVREAVPKARGRRSPRPRRSR